MKRVTTGDWIRAGILGASVAVAAFGCGGGGGGGSGGGPPEAGAPLDEFDTWRAMQDVLRKSPDHVVGHAQALVQAKDAAGLFALVRDEVELLPTTPTGFDSAATSIRWGWRATLRGAAGTPRERADLLQQLLTQAGFHATVVSGSPRAGARADKLLAASPIRKVDWSFTADQQTAWTQALGALPNTAGVSPIDPGHTIQTAIQGAVKGRVSSPGAVAFDATLSEVPLVAFTQNGSMVYANPNLDGLALGDSGCNAEPQPAAADEGERQLTVRLEGATSGAPTMRTTLAEQTFKASDVAGRVISASFATPVSRVVAAQETVGNADTFVPVLAVEGPGVDAATSHSLSKIGSPFTLGGDVLQFGAGGAITVGQDTTTPPPSDAGKLASVKSLAASVSGVAFPRVEIGLAALDGNMKGVAGLASDAFRVQEDGVDVVAYLRRNQSPPPRVLLLFDLSSSIPAPYVMGAPQVGHDIANAIFTQFPGSSVEVAAVDINRPAYAGSWVQDLGSVDGQLAALAGAGSDIWNNLSDVALNAGATATVIVSDMSPDTPSTADNLSHVYQGPPVLVAGVGTVDTATASQIATLSRGTVLTNVSPTTLGAAVSAAMSARQTVDYRIVYDAPESGAASRKVTVTLKNGASAPPSVSGTYAPPATPVSPDALSALYLTVETDGHSVTRRLAGSDAATAADRDEVRGALFGRYVLGVEANPPSLSVLLDEHLSERLVYQAGVRAMRAGDMATLATEAKRSFSRVPTDLRFFDAPLPDEANPADVTFVDGLTVTLHSTRPVLDTKVIRKIDMLPLVPRQTVVFAGGDGFGTTVDRTAFLAVAEAARFSTSTYSTLHGATLGVYDPLTIDAMLGPQWADAVANYGDYKIVAPTSGSPVAFWAVHPQTGEVIGVLPDGSGGGEEESTADLVERLLAILDAAERVGEALGYEGVAVWAELEAIEVQAVGNAIATLEGSPTGDPAHDLASGICQAGLGAIAGEIPGLTDLNQVFNDLASLQRLLHMLDGLEGPHLPGPVEAACESLLH